mmetsp:Transcript_90057/g.255217  ORF Transcript_90057/g.255217 Transcript_90057/m.255217 type:complete len:363 (-) Transcript_90057:1127-2215(-)
MLAAQAAIAAAALLPRRDAHARGRAGGGVAAALPAPAPPSDLVREPVRVVGALGAAAAVRGLVRDSAHVLQAAERAAAEPGEDGLRLRLEELLVRGVVLGREDDRDLREEVHDDVDDLRRAGLDAVGPQLRGRGVPDLLEHRLAGEAEAVLRDDGQEPRPHGAQHRLDEAGLREGPVREHEDARREAGGVGHGVLRPEEVGDHADVLRLALHVLDEHQARGHGLPVRVVHDDDHPEAAGRLLHRVLQLPAEGLGLHRAHDLVHHAQGEVLRQHHLRPVADVPHHVLGQLERDAVGREAADVHPGGVGVDELVGQRGEVREHQGDDRHVFYVRRHELPHAPGPAEELAGQEGDHIVGVLDVPE